MEERDWRTLALIPADDGVSTYDVASLIVAIGARQGATIGLFDFRDVRMNRVYGVIDEVAASMRDDERVVFAARSVKENLATVPLARSTDGAILCVTLGSTPLSLIEEAVDKIGRDRFFGSLVVHPLSRDMPGVEPSPWFRQLGP
jgi:hypothetical protein